MDKVFVVTTEIVTLDDFNVDVNGVFTSEEDAKKRMREAIDSACEVQKEDLAFDYEDESDELGYDSFEEYWEDWVKDNFVTPNFWRLNEEEMTIVVAISKRTLNE
jgi:hypothetical protein